MQTKNLEKFIMTHEKIKKMSNFIMTNEEDKRQFSLCLTELYCRAKRIIQLTDAICDDKYQNESKDNFDFLLTKLVDLKIEIYDEIVDWINELKMPLENAINKTEQKLN